MVVKRVLCPARVRKPPPQFSWVDQRPVRERYLERCDANALALYLFLLTVADRQGLSYYSDAAIVLCLSMDAMTLHRARRDLVRAELIAYETPLYQVALEPPRAVANPEARGGPPHSLREWLGQAGGRAP
jgi:hypothetical protein